MLLLNILLINMNRILLFSISFFLLLSCNKKNTLIDGYYYNDTYSILYHFDKSELSEFNLLDSTHVKSNYKLLKNTLQIDKKKYKYKSENDTLVLYKHGGDSINSKLIKFNLNEYDKKKIESKIWKISYDTFIINIFTKEREKYKQIHFHDIKFDKGIKYYYRDYLEIRTDTIYAGKIAYAGKYFDKFHVFRDYFVIFIITNFHKNKIDCIHYGGFLDSYKLSLEDCNCRIRYPRDYILTSYSKKITVIGPRETFREFAKATKANFLDIPDNVWTWEKDRKFLKEVVKRDDIVEVYGVFDPAKIDTNSILSKEIKYLTNHGYKWTDDFSYLISNYSAKKH